MGKEVDTQAVEVVSDQGTKTVAEKGKTYSIELAAKKLKRSVTWVKKHKAIVLEAFAKDVSRVVDSNGSLNEFGLKQLEEIKPFAAQGAPENYKITVWAKHPNLKPGKDSERSSDQGSDQGDEHFSLSSISGEIVVQELAEIEVDYGSEYGEGAAIARREAQVAIQQGFQTAFQSVSFLRTAVREMVRQEVSAAFFEGVSAGIQDGQSVVQSQVASTPEAPKVTKKRS